MGFHWQELLIILILALVLFGPKRLPEIGSSLGRGIREFRQSMTGIKSEIEGDAKQSETVPVPVAADQPASRTPDA